jgi:hypothetical protein
MKRKWNGCPNAAHPHCPLLLFWCSLTPPQCLFERKFGTYFLLLSNDVHLVAAFLSLFRGGGDEDDSCRRVALTHCALHYIHSHFS